MSYYFLLPSEITQERPLFPVHLFTGMVSSKKKTGVRDLLPRRMIARLWMGIKRAS